MTGHPETVALVVDGRHIQVAVWGHSDAPAVILLHGLRDHGRSWDRVAAALATGYRVIAPDLRGHGDSDWAGPDGYALAAFVADVHDIARAFGLVRYALVGHSLGGAIALRLAAADANRVWAMAGIECIELPIQRDEAAAATPYAVRLRQWLDRRAQARARGPRHYPTRAEAMARMHGQHPDLATELVDALAAHALVHDADKGWRWKFDPRVRLRAPEDQRAHDLDDVLDAIACPVRLFYDTGSWVPVPGPARLARLKHPQITHYTGAGHWLHHQFTSRFIAETRAFLDTHHRTHDHA